MLTLWCIYSLAWSPVYMPATMATLPAGCDGTCSWARKQTWHLGALACAKGEVNVLSGAGVGNYQPIPFPERSVGLFVVTLSQGLCWWDGCQGCREVVSLGAPEESKCQSCPPSGLSQQHKWPGGQRYISVTSVPPAPAQGFISTDTQCVC